MRSNPGDRERAGGFGDQGRIAGSAVVTIGGQKIGVVGNTTQLLASISSPGGVVGKTPTADDMAALARVLQPAIDALLAQGINKIVLSSQLQQFQLEQALIPLLRGVDIVISAGSHALFADGTSTIRPGDTAAQAYPVLLRGADGNPVLQVNSENEYAYVNRLVVQLAVTNADGSVRDVIVAIRFIGSDKDARQTKS